MRAPAALGVVAFHTDGIVAAHGWLVHVFPRVSRYGEIGVDVFFVISGFVMALATLGLPPGIQSARSFARSYAPASRGSCRSTGFSPRCLSRSSRSCRAFPKRSVMRA
ncbi:hypothetical protein [Paraburkholderia sp. Clong3]|uniref:hypothetical protein n=1 Tax=Paraburkholderia sp. Clong3 TaxID=2991061 RepID=UPI003D1EDD2C